MSMIEDFRESQGAGYWIHGPNMGPLPPDSKGRPRNGPRMTVVAANGRWCLNAAWWQAGLNALHVSGALFWIAGNYDRAEPISMAGGFGVLAFGFALSLYQVVLGIRFDVLIPTLKVREVGGLHDDTRLRAVPDAEPAPEPRRQSDPLKEPTEIEVDYEDVLPPDEDERAAS